MRRTGTANAPQFGVVSSEPPRSTATSFAAAPLRVLLAEDDAEMRRLLVTTLRRNQCDVIEAKSGAQLWDLVVRCVLGAQREQAVDLIISDVRMPGASGLEILARLRTYDSTTPVIMITAFGDPETHAEAKRLGALAVFNKPFDLDDLRVLVASLRRLAPTQPAR